MVGRSHSLVDPLGTSFQGVGMHIIMVLVFRVWTEGKQCQCLGHMCACGSDSDGAQVHM